MLHVRSVLKGIFILLLIMGCKGGGSSDPQSLGATKNPNRPISTVSNISVPAQEIQQINKDLNSAEYALSHDELSSVIEKVELTEEELAELQKLIQSEGV